MAERRAFNATSMLQQACVRQGIDLAALVAETAIWANPEVHRMLVAANPTGAWFPGFRRARTGSGEVRGGGSMASPSMTTPAPTRPSSAQSE